MLPQILILVHMLMARQLRTAIPVTDAMIIGTGIIFAMLLPALISLIIAMTALAAAGAIMCQRILLMVIAMMGMIMIATA
jgi:hypothetical protein